MNWFDWVLIGFWSVSGLLMVNNIGKPRKPISNAEAVLGVIIAAIFISCLVVTR